MIGLLLALHPRSWRARYGEELRALLETAPLTPTVVGDVLRNAARQHARVHRGPLQLLAAVVLSALVEVAAVHSGVTVNILWAPTSPVRAVALVAVLLPWLPATRTLGAAVRRRRRRVR